MFVRDGYDVCDDSTDPILASSPAGRELEMTRIVLEKTREALYS
jgi:hypothetical protein